MTKTLLFITLMLVAPVAGAEEQYTLTMSNAIGFIPSSSEYTCRIDDRNLKINCLNHKDSKGNYQQRKNNVSKKEKPDLLEITMPGTCNEEYPCMCASPNKKCSCLCYFKNNEKLFINCHSECFEVQPAEEAKPESTNSIGLYQLFSDAEKWRALCQDYSDSCESTGYSCDRSQIYCTRALIEEMRNK